MNKAFTISELGRESGVNPETIRYYERTGLLAAPARADNGYRRYDEAANKRLRFIRRGRELGFGIEEIKTLLQLADHPEHECHQADSLARAHLAEVESRIADLLSMRDVLSKLVGCQSGTAEHCRLIEALDQRNCCSRD